MRIPGRGKGRNWGGARPGAGRKSDAVREQQAANRLALLMIVTEDDIRAVTDMLLEKAKAGDVSAFRTLCRYLLSSPDADVNVKPESNRPARVEVVCLVDGAPQSDAA